MRTKFTLVILGCIIGVFSFSVRSHASNFQGKASFKYPDGKSVNIDTKIDTVHGWFSYELDEITGNIDIPFPLEETNVNNDSQDTDYEKLKCSFHSKDFQYEENADVHLSRFVTQCRNNGGPIIEIEGAFSHLSITYCSGENDISLRFYVHKLESNGTVGKQFLGYVYLTKYYSDTDKTF